MKKKEARLIRAAKGRAMIKANNMVCLTVHRTPKHIYAQVISADGTRVIVASSTQEKSFKNDIIYTGNTQSAKQVGHLIARRAIEAGVKEVAFDRSGFKYHGRVKALADAARQSGLEF